MQTLHEVDGGDPDMELLGLNSKERKYHLRDALSFTC